MARRSRHAINALVIDQDTREFGLDYVPDAPAQAERYRFGSKGRLAIFVLVRTREGALVSVKLPERQGGLPERLYRALDWREVDELFSFTSDLWGKLNTIAALALVFVLFIAIVALGG